MSLMIKTLLVGLVAASSISLAAAQLGGGANVGAGAGANVGTGGAGVGTGASTGASGSARLKTGPPRRAPMSARRSARESESPAGITGT
jgi:hypothetical protein